MCGRLVVRDVGARLGQERPRAPAPLDGDDRVERAVADDDAGERLREVELEARARSA